MNKHKKTVFHILPNAHLDPVWLWDWREGLNEGITTVKTILDLMDENPELTFMRGEASIYEHIQRTAPDVFRRVRNRIEEGRWDVVGGTYVQPDSNLSSTETLCRNFERSLRYFQKELGVRPTIAWQADSFGHTAGWPNILRSFGMEGFSFTRPQQAQFPLSSPAFWWDCDHKDRLLCYRQHWMWYCSERLNLPQILDETLKGASTQPFKNVGVLMGLGNHGGGPTRKHLAEIADWKEHHREIEVRYSTLSGFFRDLRKELESLPRKQVPSFGGEFGFCLRGCYSSVQKFKSLYRHAEAAVTGAEITQSVIAKNASPSVSLDEAWESVMFNSFHDILPGSSIERAMEDQMAWTGLVIHHSRNACFAALNTLASQVDTRVPAPESCDSPTDVPVLVWNSLPREFHGPVEIEASLDYRPMFDYKNRAQDLPFALRNMKGGDLPFQEIATEHTSMEDLPWRKRVVTHLTIPALGWKVVRMGLAKQKPDFVADPSNCVAKPGAKPRIANAAWQVAADATGRVIIKKDGQAFFPGSLRLLVVDDSWGSWGGMDEDPKSFSLTQTREEWKVAEARVLEHGPERARLWTRWQGKNSWTDLTFDVYKDLPWICVQGRMLWNERSARLQLVIPSRDTAICDVPGSVVARQTIGQVPIGRWFHRQNKLGQRLGVASDVLSDADFLPNETRLTLARASRYANDVPTAAADKRWQPAVDCGELKFKLAFFAEGVDPDHVADSLLHSPATLPVPPTAGPLPTSGTQGSLSPKSVRLLALESTADGLRVRIQNRGRGSCNAKLRIGKTVHSLGRVESQQIRTQLVPFPR